MSRLIENLAGILRSGLYVFPGAGSKLGEKSGVLFGKMFTRSGNR